MAKPARQIGLPGALAIGFASMFGAGVFSVFALAYSSSGSLLVIALALAALTASLNAASIYQLAQKNSRPGGVYSYARSEWNSTASFVAGFSFVFGKIGSIAAIGYIFAEYIAPSQAKWVAAGAIVVLTLLNALGINRTALVAAILSIATTAYLLLTGVAGAAHSSQGFALFDFMALPKVTGVLPAAALLFFAFAGYARVATLGDEVRNAKRNIPRAIAISLIGVLATYLLIAFALTNTLGDKLASSSGSFLSMNEISLSWMPAWVTIVIASGASLGSMLALLAGVSRTAATMAEDGELAKAFALRNRFGAPWLAEALVGGGAIVVLFAGSQLSWIIGFSSFSVLLYYAIGHVSAYLSGPAPVWRRAVQWVGFTLCAVLLFSVPGPAVWVSTGVVCAAVVIRRLVRQRQAR